MPALVQKSPDGRIHIREDTAMNHDSIDECEDGQGQRHHGLKAHGVLQHPVGLPVGRAFLSITRQAHRTAPLRRATSAQQRRN
jgi:hypothetical protein